MFEALIVEWSYNYSKMDTTERDLKKNLQKKVFSHRKLQQLHFLNLYNTKQLNE